jgi:hypothetical protein
MLKQPEMTPRERLLAVYRGETPDRVPALADLFYWYAAHGGGKFIPGHTCSVNAETEQLRRRHWQNRISGAFAVRIRNRSMPP